MAAEQEIILIKKKKGGHGGHHGGAWKVAYADFVTAMMALFIVLWLLSSTSKQTQEEIAGYFNDPKGTSGKKGSDQKGPGQVKEEQKDDMARLKTELAAAIQAVNDLNKLKKQIEMTITDEGLRIEMLEDEKGTFFESGSSHPMPVLDELLKVLAGQMKNLPNKISIEGHTDAQPYAKETSYGNWELSADRANVARREMQASGIRMDQVSQVRGFADQRLHNKLKPFDASNRRISLIVQNLPKPGKAEEVIKTADAKPSAGKAEEAKAGEDKAGEAKPSEEKHAEGSSEAKTAPAAEAHAPEQASGSFLKKATKLFH